MEGPFQKRLRRYATLLILALTFIYHVAAGPY